MTPVGLLPSRGSFTTLVAVLGIVASGNAAASSQRMPTADTSEREIARCIRQAAGGRGWLEKTLWGLRDQEAGWVGAEVRNSNGTHDLGPLQINSWWVPRIAERLDRPAAHVRYWLQYDPCFNAEAARWIFLSGLSVTRDYWQAIGTYHSPTAWRQRRYARLVATKLSRRFGGHAFSKPVSK